MAGYNRRLSSDPNFLLAWRIWVKVTWTQTSTGMLTTLNSNTLPVLFTTIPSSLWTYNFLSSINSPSPSSFHVSNSYSYFYSFYCTRVLCFFNCTHSYCCSFNSTLSYCCSFNFTCSCCCSFNCTCSSCFFNCTRSILTVSQPITLVPTIPPSTLPVSLSLPSLSSGQLLLLVAHLLFNPWMLVKHPDKVLQYFFFSQDC